MPIKQINQDEIATLKNVFFVTALKYTAHDDFIASAWKKIENNYNSPSRHYHNLCHLRNMLGLAESRSLETGDKEIIIFSIFYHDLVYSALKKDNEEKSAAEAVHFLNGLGFPFESAERVKKYILATKNHLNEPCGADPLLDFFLDLDLSVLGSEPDAYQTYTQQIRKEYCMIPGPIYRKGRKKVLEYFLSGNFIFRTSDFNEKWEQKARKNLKTEFEQL